MVILLTILKIIGIILLSLLGLLVLLVLLVLFYPVGYRIRGSVEEDVTLCITAHWLFSLIRFVFQIDEKKSRAWIHICGIRIMLIPAKEKKPKKRKKVRKKKQVVQADDTGSADSAGNTDDAGNADNTENADDERNADDAGQEVVLSESNAEDNVKEDIEQEEKVTSNSLWKKIMHTLKNFWQRLKRIPRFFANFRQHTANLKQKLSNWKTQIFDISNRNALKFVCKELIHLLQHYHPRKIKADICYSAGDPALTGQILAALSIFPFLYQYHFSVKPDFESEEFYFKGTFDIKGHIQIFHLLTAAWRVYRNQDVRAFIKKVR